MVGCWPGYLPRARCRLAYGPADASATHCLLLPLIKEVLFLEQVVEDPRGNWQTQVHVDKKDS